MCPGPPNKQVLGLYRLEPQAVACRAGNLSEAQVIHPLNSRAASYAVTIIQEILVIWYTVSLIWSVTSLDQMNTHMTII